MRPLFPALLLFLALTCVPQSCLAQRGGGRKGGSHPSAPAIAVMPDYRTTRADIEFDRTDTTQPSPGKPHLKSEQPACFHWPMAPVLSSAVSVTGMQVPGKARQEFDRGCAAVRKNSLDEAQKRLNRALQTYPAFAEAWVLLGQTEKEAGKTAGAEQSCIRGKQADPNYLPAYLCLADIAARQAHWSQVVDLTNQAIALRPVRAPSAFYYNCLANFYLRQFDAAEKSGLRVTEEGSKEQKAWMHLLLAKIYEGKGDRASEAVQLHQYLKLAPHAPAADAARHVLAQIEGDPRASARTPEKK